MSATAWAWSGSWLGQPADHHVGVAHGLDLLQLVALGKGVQGREQVVQDLHDPLRGGLAAAPGEVDQVGEQHRDLGEVVGDDLLALLEPVRDRAREDVQQQALGTLLLGQEQAVLPVEGAAGPHRLAQQQHRRQQGQVRHDAVEQLGPDLRGELVRHGHEDEGTEAEPGDHRQRPASVAGGPGGGQRHRQRHRREQARVVGQVVDRQGRRRDQQHGQGPAPPNQGQGAQGRPQQVGVGVR